MLQINEWLTLMQELSTTLRFNKMHTNTEERRGRIDENELASS
jgi:hypothetical protein